MRPYIILLIISLAHAAPLTEEERTTLLSKIDALESKALNSNEMSQRTAISRFMRALDSDKATFELFLECREKVLFEEEKRREKDARDATRGIKDSVSREFKRALRHQLYWLTYSLEAKRNPDTRLDQAAKLARLMHTIYADIDDLNYEMVFNKTLPSYSFNDPKKRQERSTQSRDDRSALGGSYSPLHQNPFQSVFAKAFDIDHMKPDSWPQSPMDYNGLFLNVIVKELAEGGRYDDARKYWTDRIKLEAAFYKELGIEPGSNNYGDTPASLDKFQSFTLPELIWAGEQALFDAGDKREAAINLYKTLEKYQGHPKYLSWVEQLKKQLTPPEEAEQ